MRRLALLIAFASISLFANADERALQRSFVEAARHLQAGDPARAESILRGMLEATDSPRVKLELARALYVQGKYGEAKALFREVSMQAQTPWRVRDNIEHFVRAIEERTGYLKLGATIISDSNPRNLAAQREFSIGDLRVTPTEAPKKVYGLRYSARGWLPLSESSGLSGYLAAAYNDYEGEELDRLTLDLGVVRPLTSSGRLRGKLGVESGTFGGKRLYSFPYVGLDSVLAQTEAWRLTAEMKAGKVSFPDFAYLDATYASSAFSASRAVSSSGSVSLSGSLERSSAAERPYTYDGWELGPGVNWFWLDSAFLLGVRASVGERRYAAADPLFGLRRRDAKVRLELTLGNKRWRWRHRYVSLLASLEQSDSNIGFYDYRKTNFSAVIE